MKFLISTLIILVTAQNAITQTLPLNKTQSTGKSGFAGITSDTAVSDVSKIFPLVMGSRYHYSDYQENTTNGIFVYSMKTRYLNRDTLINGKKYYGFSDEPHYYRHDTDSNRVLMRYNQQEGLFYGFGMPNGSVVRRLSPYGYNFVDVVIDVSMKNTFGNLRKTYKDRIEENCAVKWVTYTENIGLTGNYEYFDGCGPSGSNSHSELNILDALIYNEDGSYTYYSPGYKPTLSVSPFSALKGDAAQFNFTCAAHHSFDRLTRHQWTLTDGIVFIDSVRLSYFYRKGSLNTPIQHIDGIRKDTMGNYSFNIPVDTSLLRHGYDFMYKITAKDKSFIPNYVSSPDTGYYRAVYDPALKVSESYLQALTFSLEQNYPNPFNPATRITYSVAVKGMVKMAVYNTLGEMIKMLVSEEKEPGEYSTVFNASGLSSGVYFCRLSSGTFVSTRKMVLMK